MSLFRTTNTDSLIKSFTGEIAKSNQLIRRLSDTRITLIQKNWKELNREFSALLTKRSALLESCEKFIRSRPEDIKQNTKDALERVVEQTFKNHIEILYRLTAHSVAFGRKKYPVEISTKEKGFFEKYAPRLPSFISEPLRFLYNHSGKIAFAASLVILASYTQEGAELFQKGATVATESLETIKDPLFETAKTVAGFLKSHLAEVGSALSVVWAVPAAIRNLATGKYKTAGASLALGAVIAAGPFVLPAGFSVQKAISL